MTSSTTTEEDEEETEGQEEEEHESDVVESEAAISKGGDSRLLKRLSETLVWMQSVNVLVRPDFPVAEVLQPPCDVSDIADLLSPEWSTSIVDIINSSSQVEDDECDDEESDDESSVTPRDLNKELEIEEGCDTPDSFFDLFNDSCPVSTSNDNDNDCDVYDSSEVEEK